MQCIKFTTTKGSIVTILVASIAIIEVMLAKEEALITLTNGDVFGICNDENVIDGVSILKNHQRYYSVDSVNFRQAISS